MAFRASMPIKNEKTRITVGAVAAVVTVEFFRCDRDGVFVGAATTMTQQAVQSACDLYCG